MKHAIFLVSLLITTSIYGAYPTVEGLFRHSGNKDIEGELVIVKLLIEEIEAPEKITPLASEEAGMGIATEGVIETAEATAGAVATPSTVIDEIKVEPEIVEVENGKKLNPEYWKLIFTIKEDERPGLLQAVYRDSKMTNSSIEKVDYYNDISNIFPMGTTSEKLVTYSLIQMFALNNSDLMSMLLKRKVVDYKSNIELINPDKVEVLSKYREFLIAKSAGIELPSPMAPEEPEARVQVKEIMDQPMYQKENFVTLDRVRGAFYWRVKFDNFDALFSNERHRLVEMQLREQDGDIKVSAGEYILFNGIQELPKYIYITTKRRGLYKIQILSYKAVTSKSSLSTISERYLKAYGEAKARKEATADSVNWLLSPLMF